MTPTSPPGPATPTSPSGRATVSSQPRPDHLSPVDDLFADGASRWVPAGTRILSMGAEVRAVFLIRVGEIDLRSPGSGGRRLAAIARTGDTVGDTPLLAGQPMAYDAIARARTHLVELSHERFLARLARTPRLTAAWLRLSSRRVEDMDRHLMMLTTKTLTQQVASLLLLHQRPATDAAGVVALSHGDLADLLGARRPSVTRVIRTLRAHGLVHTSYGCLEILDPSALSRVAAADYPEPSRRERPDSVPIQAPLSASCVPSPGTLRVSATATQKATQRRTG